MTKQELIDIIAKEQDMTKKDVTGVVDCLFEEIKKTVKKGDKIQFVGFGGFEPKTNKARNGINPATKEKIKIKASKSVKFKAGKGFKDFLN